MARCHAANELILSVSHDDKLRFWSGAARRRRTWTKRMTRPLWPWTSHGSPRRWGEGESWAQVSFGLGCSVRVELGTWVDYSMDL